MVAITTPHQLPDRPRLRLVGAETEVRIRPDLATRALVVLAAVVVLLAGAYLLGSGPDVAPTDGVAVAEASHVVAPGETMWSIAVELAPPGEAAGYVERLVEVNGSASVEPGQVLRLPRS